MADNKIKEEKIISVDHANKSSGALILEKSPNFEGTSNLLTNNRDLYAMVPCEVEGTKYIIVGLSEDILIKRIKLSSFERYSSTTKKFQVLGSQTYPISTEWEDLGTFVAKPWFKENKVQTFELKEPSWARYLKFRLLTHYGVEHYCTLTQIQVHGSTTLQGYHEMQKLALEKEEELVALEKEEELEKEKIVTEEAIETQQKQKATTIDNSHKTNEDETKHIEAELGKQNETIKSPTSKESIEVEEEETTNANSLVTEPDGKIEIQGDDTTATSSTKDVTEDDVDVPQTTDLKDDPNDSKDETKDNISDTKADLKSDIKSSNAPQDDVLQDTLVDDTSAEKLDSDVIRNDSENHDSEIQKDVLQESTASQVEENVTNMEEGLEDKEEDKHTDISTDKPSPVSENDNTQTDQRDMASSEEQMLDDKSGIDMIDKSSAEENEFKDQEDGEIEESTHSEEDTVVASGSMQKKSDQSDSILKEPDNNDVDEVIAQPTSVQSNTSHKNVSSLKTPITVMYDTKRFPSTACLESLDFNEFKANLIRADTLRTNTGSSGLASMKNQPIFQKLQDEIKVLQTSQGIYEQYMKEVTSCHHQVISGMISHIDDLERDQATRFSKMEEQLHELMMKAESDKINSSYYSKAKNSINYAMNSIDYTMNSISYAMHSISYIQSLWKHLIAQIESNYKFAIELMAMIEENVKKTIALLFEYERELKAFFAGILTCFIFLHIYRFYSAIKQRIIKSYGSKPENAVKENNQLKTEHLDDDEDDTISISSTINTSSPGRQRKKKKRSKRKNQKPPILQVETDSS